MHDGVNESVGLQNRQPGAQMHKEPKSRSESTEQYQRDICDFIIKEAGQIRSAEEGI